MNQLPRHPRSQVQIESNNLDADRVVVDKIMSAALDKFGLYDNTHTSRVRQTIRSVVEGNGFGFGFGARVVENLIIVDLGRLRSDSPKFDEAHDFILRELNGAFHAELVEIWEDNPIYRKTC